VFQKISKKFRCVRNSVPENSFLRRKRDKFLKRFFLTEICAKNFDTKNKFLKLSNKKEKVRNYFIKISSRKFASNDACSRKFPKNSIHEKLTNKNIKILHFLKKPCQKFRFKNKIF